MNQPKFTPVADLSLDADWWRGAAIYQIYPRSFQDSNGDGVGDLRGITDRLSYVANLGVDAIWISPFFTSPMEDFGYDVSDHCSVDPMFGTLEDFDALIATAHELGLRVMIDLVLSHTAAQHPWFVESRRDKTNAKADWYVWADAKPDGSPPNNWLSIFGGPAWQWDSTRLQYYMHNFLTSQPDLNLHNRGVQDALLETARFWLDRGTDGFRLDTVNFYFCDEQLRDNPPLAEAERNSTIAPAVNPYNFQEHIYDKNRPENIEFLRRLRAVMDEYTDIASIGEVGDAQIGLQIMSQYTAGDDLLHMCYAFDFLSGTSLDAERVKNVLLDFTANSSESWSCWAVSNHDVQRHASRWNLSNKAQTLIFSLMASLRGSICIYQGEELGLPEAEISFDDIQDPYGKIFWPEFKGRDGCRTPMVWTSEVPNAGFSDATTWLPIPETHSDFAVSKQENQPDSLLNHYRSVLAMRKAMPELIKGTLADLDVKDNVISFERILEGRVVFCAFNMGDTAQQFTLGDGDWYTPEHTDNSKLDTIQTLEPWQAFYARKR